MSARDDCSAAKSPLPDSRGCCFHLHSAIQPRFCEASIRRMELTKGPARCSICGARTCATSRLIRGIQVGEPTAWQRLVEKASPLVHLWCRRAGVHPSDTADVLQEVFAAAWQGITVFCPDREGLAFPAWLRGIARHKIADHFRRSTRHAETAMGFRRLICISSEEEPAQGEGCCLCGHLQKALEEAQAEFEPRTWNAFWRTTVDEQPAAEVGAPLGMTAGAVRRAKHKVLQRLRKRLRPAP